MAVERTMRIDLQLASGGSVSRRDRNRNGAAGCADACPDRTAESKAGHAAHGSSAGNFLGHRATRGSGRDGKDRH